MSDQRDEPTSKRIKKATNILQGALNSNILHRADDLRKSYSNAKPYPHGVIQGLFETPFITNVLDEFKNNMKAKYKESDLFRVYQSIDLANLDPKHKSNHELMPNVMRLREILYSQEYRSFIENISGIASGTLIDKVDCALNCHDKGCHLLCHDDVIGTRKVSYILYLTDPEPEWTDDDGGRLELYESNTILEEYHDNSKVLVETKVPSCFPKATVLPKFNSMAYFVVEPGVSFHSVQEVFCDRPRLSLQGWYHARETPINIENATLNQLKSNHAKDLDGNYRSYMNLSDEDLSQGDIEFLSTFINPTYLMQDAIEQIRSTFEEESSLQLRHFFNDKWEKTISKLIEDEDKKDNIGRDKAVLDYSVGTSEEWIPQGPPHKQRFLIYVGNGAGNSLGSILKHLKEDVMQSDAFGRLLKRYTSLGFPLGHRGKVRRFRPGLDYTIAHYGVLTKEPVLDATVCFVSGKGDQCIGEENDDEDDIIWQSDNSGGFECYIEADDDEDEKEAEDEYDEEDDTKLLSVSASNNSLSLVYRDPGTMRFVKYVNASAPSSRFDISLEYKVENIKNDYDSESRSDIGNTERDVDDEF